MIEGHTQASISVTGNTVIDALFWVLARLDRDQNRKNHVKTLLSKRLHFEIEKAEFILITGHRKENFGSGFINICQAIAELAARFPKAHFVYPVHLNPNVQEPVTTLLSNIDNVHLIDPVDYEPFVYLLQNCYLIAY